MSPLSTKVLLCIVLCLSICQYTQSRYLESKSGNVTYDSPINATVFDANNDEAITNITEESTTALMFQSFPYMVEVQHILGDVNFRSCAGTILSKRWVLTAAHCVGKNPGIFFVYFDVDEFDIEQSIPRPLDGMSMIVRQTFKHPQYAEGYNDIALLYMPQDIPFSNNIQPIKLAPYESSMNEDIYVVGWRKKNTTSESTIETMKLKYATLPIIENNVCRQHWPINDKHICTAAGLGQFACPERNSNDPLIVKINGQDFQIGIMSYGDQSCPDNLPRVYTKVSSHINWILEVMNKRISA